MSQIPGAFLDLLIAVASREAPKAVLSLHPRLRADALSHQNKSVRTQTKIDGARAKRVLEQHAAPVPSSFPRFSSAHARSAALVPLRPLPSLSFTLLPPPRWSVSFATMSTRLLDQFSHQEFEEQHCHIVGGQFKRAPGRVPALVMSC